MHYLSRFSEEKVSELDQSPSFLTCLQKRQRKLTGQSQIGRNGIDNDYINAIIVIQGELYELEHGDWNIASFLEQILEIQTPEEYFRAWREKYGYTSRQIVGRLKLPHILPIIRAINWEIEKLKKLATDIKQKNEISEIDKKNIRKISEILVELIRKVWSNTTTIDEVKQEVDNLLWNSHVPIFSCRESWTLWFQLKEIFLWINYGEWKKWDEKILETDSKKWVLDFRWIPDNYLQDSQDINSWYWVFFHVLANGISNKAEWILLHYEKDLYFRIVREIINGEERFTAIFSMQN